MRGQEVGSVGWKQAAVAASRRWRRFPGYPRFVRCVGVEV